MITSLFLIPIFVYLGLLVLALLVPDRLIFRPPPSSYLDHDDTIKLKTPGSEYISARHYPNPDARFTILFSHGNAEDIGDIEPLALYLRDAGFAVLTYDYRGYGTSEGVPSEEKSYEDIDAAYRYLTEELKVPEEKIILHGRSLGGGPSTDLAARQPVGGLILESTFTTAFRTVIPFTLFPFDKFRNANKIVAAKCPVLVIHGREDRTVGFHHGEALFAAAPGAKYQLWVDDAGHNDLAIVAGDSYLDAIREFSSILAK